MDTEGDQQQRKAGESYGERTKRNLIIIPVPTAGVPARIRSAPERSTQQIDAALCRDNVRNLRRAQRICPHRSKENREGIMPRSSGPAYRPPATHQKFLKFLAAESCVNGGLQTIQRVDTNLTQRSEVTTTSLRRVRLDQNARCPVL